MVRSLPMVLWCSENSAVTTAQIVWLPWPIHLQSLGSCRTSLYKPREHAERFFGCRMGYEKMIVKITRENVATDVRIGK